jgi:hypothetical protein
MKCLTRLLCMSALLVSVAFAESLDETRKKAESGDAQAQFNLGFRHAFGTGVPQDYAEAAKWYRLAADQGLAIAQFTIALMYEKGDGVPKDLVQAHAWFNIAGAAGNEEAKKTQAILEKQITDTQKEKAMDLARELFAKLPKTK